ncbi:MAG: hypothetical protein IAF94_14060 [Pirellulaceae bacterium]|nr:hypothetical protein [Pirellulaceae bacterium]
MKYSLRSLMIVALLGPPLLAWTWFVWESVKWRFEPPRIPVVEGPSVTIGPHIIPATTEGRKAATEEWRRHNEMWRRRNGLPDSLPKSDDKP